MFIRFPFFSSLGTIRYSFHHKFAPMSCTGESSPVALRCCHGEAGGLCGRKGQRHLSLNLNALLPATFSCHFIGVHQQDLENYEIVKARVVLSEVIDPSLMTIVHTGILRCILFFILNIFGNLCLSLVFTFSIKLPANWSPMTDLNFINVFNNYWLFLFSCSRYNDYTRLSVHFSGDFVK